MESEVDIVCITSLTPSVSTMRIHIELMFVLKAIIFRFKGSCDIHNLIPSVISYEIYDTRTPLDQ